MEHVAWAVHGGGWHRDQSMFATIFCNCVNGGTPCAPAPRSEHVVCEVEFIVFPAVVLPEENLDMLPRALDGICVCPGVRIDEVDAVVNGLMHITLSTEIAVRNPAITNDLSAGFHPVTYYGHYCVGGAVLNGNKKFYPRLVRHRQTPTDPLQGVPYDTCADRTCSCQFRRSCLDHQS
jgi:hypothetical protein